MSEKQPATPRPLYPLKFQPLLVISVSWLLGILLGEQLSPDWRGPGLFFCLLLFGLCLSLSQWKHTAAFLRKWKQWFPLSPAWLVLFFSLGILRFTLSQTPLSPHSLAYYNDLGPAEITAIITKPPELTENSTRFIAQAKTIHLTPNDPHAPVLEVTGGLQVSTLTQQQLKIGDQVRLYCQPETPQDFSGFQYQRYLAIRGVQTVCSFTYAEVIESHQGSRLLAGISALRIQAEKNLTEILPSDEAALLSGILLGIESRISPEVEHAFSETGTAHIIAISGANFTFLISALSVVLLKHLPKRWYLPILFVFVSFYTVFVGGNAAVLRAAFMVMMTQVGRLQGRKNQGLNSLAFSAAVLCLFNPLLLWDLSFQLSFGATLGLVLFADPMTAWFQKQMEKILSEIAAHRVTDYAGEYLLMSIAAQIFTTPLIAYTFKTLSVSSLFANVLILPAQPLIMILGMLTAILSFIFLPFAQLLAGLTWLPLTFTLRVVQWIADWSWASIRISGFPVLYLISYSIIVTAIPLVTAWLPRLKIEIRQTALLILSVAITVLLWNTALHQPARDVHIHLFDLADNHSVLIQLPDGNAILLDRAQSMDSLQHQLQNHLPGYTLSAVILPENNRSTLNNLNPLILRHNPGYLFVPPEIIPDAYSRILQDMKTTEIQPLRDQQNLQINESANLEILAIRPTGTAFRFNYENLHALIPGSVSYSELKQLTPDALQDLSLLILNSEDLEDGQIASWSSIAVPVTLINGAIADCPTENCYSTAELGGLQFHSDGENYWLEADSTPIE